MLKDLGVELLIIFAVLFLLLGCPILLGGQTVILNKDSTYSQTEIIALYSEMKSHGGNPDCSRFVVGRGYFLLHPDKECSWVNGVCSWVRPKDNTGVDVISMDVHICSCDTRLEYDEYMGKNIRKLLIGNLVTSHAEMPEMTGLIQRDFHINSETGVISVTFRDGKANEITYHWRYSIDGHGLVLIRDLEHRRALGLLND